MKKKRSKVTGVPISEQSVELLRDQSYPRVKLLRCFIDNYFYMPHYSYQSPIMDCDNGGRVWEDHLYRKKNGK